MLSLHRHLSASDKPEPDCGSSQICISAKSSRAKVLAAISKTQGQPSSNELGRPFCQQIDVLTNSLLACKRLPAACYASDLAPSAGVRRLQLGADASFWRLKLASRRFGLGLRHH